MSLSDKKKIIVDIERMKYPNTGLHNYCKNLYEFLLKDPKFDYHFFSHKKVDLPSTIQRINRKIFDKFYLKLSSQYKLWHGTYQTTKYIPRKPIKFVLTIHDLNFLYEDISLKKKDKLLQEVQKRIDRADYVTTISKFTLDDVAKHLDIKNKAVKVIYNGVNLIEYPNFNAPRYKPNKSFFFALGTVLYKKNFHELLKLMKSRKDVELLIGGIHSNSVYLDDLKTKITDLDVSENVKLLGAVTEEEKYWYLNTCKAFLFPSLSEGFGIPVIEAMLLGKPVFLSKKTSLPEIGGKYAYYFDNFEESHMNDVLEQGLLDYDSNKDKKTQIINWASQFSWERAAREYEEVYKEVLGIK